MPKVFVNGREVDVEKPVVTYEEVVALAGMKGTPSATYHRAMGGAGTLLPGDTIALRDGAVLNVSHTDNA